jgi:uncharacterized protein
MTLQITSLLTGLFALMMVILSLQISLARVKLGGSAKEQESDKTLRRKVRAHGNFIEYAPTMLAVVGLMEFAGGSKVMVMTIAAVFFFCRVFHALGMLYTSTPALRGAAMMVQHAAFLWAGVWLILKVLPI